MLSVIILGSCDNKDGTKTDRKPVEYNSTISQLEQLNQSLINSIDPQTRGFRDGLKRFFIVAGADIVGAGTGIWASKEIIAMTGASTGGTGAIVAGAVCGVIAGAGASCAVLEATPLGVTDYDGYLDVNNLWQAYQEVIEMGVVVLSKDGAIDEDLSDVDGEIIVAKGVDINLPEGFGYLENIGILHNAVLSQLKQTETTGSPTRSFDPGVIDDGEKVEEDIYELINTQEFKNTYSSIVQLIPKVQDSNGVIDVEDYFVELSNDVYVDINVIRVYELFINLMNTYPSRLDDMETIINLYITAIQNSNDFNEEEKEMIFTGLVVAAYSPQYWIDEFGN